MEMKKTPRCNRIDFYLVTVHSVSIRNIHVLLHWGYTWMWIYVDVVNGMLTDALRQKAWDDQGSCICSYSPVFFSEAIFLAATGWGKVRDTKSRAGTKAVGAQYPDQSIINWPTREYTTKKQFFIVEWSWDFLWLSVK